jgi:5-hydroxyisourate hydrolase
MISIQIIDINNGQPAQRIPVELDYFISGQGWASVGQGITTREGRIMDFGENPAAGVYRLAVDVAAYMPHIFFPTIQITFEAKEIGEDHHLIVQISPFGFSVARTA